MKMDLSLLSDERIREALKRIIEYEEETEREYRIKYKFMDPTPWWDWQSVAVDWPIIKRLLLGGYLKVLPGRRKEYVLRDRQAVKRALEEYERMLKLREEMLYSEEEKALEIPSDFMDIIVGYDDLKRVILMSLKADKPVHILLEGPPGTAKSLILMEIERLRGSYFITAGTATKIGIRDVIFERSSPKPPGPRIFLIIDEIDKIRNPQDLSILLTWMESGRVIITKHGCHETRYSRGWVFAACNNSSRLPPELLDRFLRFRLKPYDRETFIKIVEDVLVRREGKDKELARYIAKLVADKLGSFSVRDAIKIARLAKDKRDVDMLIETMRKYGF